MPGGRRSGEILAWAKNNDVKECVGEGCCQTAASSTAKGKDPQGDMKIYCLPDELLLDFEPGLTAGVSQRSEEGT